MAQPLKMLIANGVGSQKQVKIWSLDLENKCFFLCIDAGFNHSRCCIYQL